MKSAARCALAACLLCFVSAPASAQAIEDWDCRQFTWEQLDEQRVRFMREVECNGSGPNEGHQVFADELLLNRVTGEFEAVGNVLVVSPTARIAAERAVFNTKSRLGTFYTASGSASLGEGAAEDRALFGTLEPDIYFMGETIEKIGDARYRITNGRFTTCVQPTPRWDVVTGSATIELEDYAVLRNAVLRVKDVPLFYLPVMYYPIQSDDRATGFLLPTYGTSTIRGQSLSNAFFWAINRSQDLTLMHDWYTKTGQGYGTEYRYMLGPGSEGNISAYRLMQNETVLDDSSQPLPEETSYELRGQLTQMLPAGFRARADLDYFSSLASQQLYNTDIYYASRSRRMFGGSVTGTWQGVSLTGHYRRAELFETPTRSTVNGYSPSFTANLTSTRIGTLPLYISTTSEAARHLVLQRSEGIERDHSVSRFDVQPSLRAALTNWPFLSVNATVAFRGTYYTRSLDENDELVPSGVSRRFFDMRTDVIGPTFSRVFTPSNALADRLKHVIEPTFSVQRVTSFENEERVPTVGSVYDIVIGGVTRINYGLTNRVLVRKLPRDPDASAAAGAPRELLSVTVTQSYYTDPQAALFDTSYQSGQAVVGPRSHFSPIAVTARTTPTPFTTGTLRLEFDQADGTLRSMTASGSSSYRQAQVSVGLSRTNYEGRDVLSTLNSSATLNFAQGRTGGTFAMDWDISRGYVIQHRWIGFYNAQCCGIAAEYQQFRYGTNAAGIPYDRRFNLSFTLAGIGTFSNFFGAFGGGRF